MMVIVNLLFTPVLRSILAAVLLSLTLHQVCHCILIIPIQDAGNAVELPLIHLHITKHADLLGSVWPTRWSEGDGGGGDGGDGEGGG